MPSDDQDDDIIDVYSLEDEPEKLANLGKAIKHEYSRKFLMFTDQWRNVKEIAKRIKNEDNPRIPNALGWKNKLLKAKLIRVREQLQRKKGHVLHYCKSSTFIIITKNKEMAERIKNDLELQNHLKRIAKLGAVAIATFTTFMITDYGSIFPVDDVRNTNSYPFLMFPLIVLSVGLTVLWVHERVKFTKKQTSRNIELH